MPTKALWARVLGTHASVDFLISPGHLVCKRSLIARGSANPYKVPSIDPKYCHCFGYNTGVKGATSQMKDDGTPLRRLYLSQSAARVSGGKAGLLIPLCREVGWGSQGLCSARGSVPSVKPPWLLQHIWCSEGDKQLRPSVTSRVKIRSRQDEDTAITGLSWGLEGRLWLFQCHFKPAFPAKLSYH